MKPRHRAQLRLARQVPHLTEPSDRQPVQRMALREEEVRPPRALPGASVRIVDQVTVKSLRPIRDLNHAPLLIRLVRNPYALAAGRPQRVPNDSRTRPSILDRQALPHAVAEWAAIRASRQLGNPMRDHAHRPMRRDHPFQRVRGIIEFEPEPIFFDPQAEEGWL